jgi:hypothetical protein
MKRTLVAFLALVSGFLLPHDSYAQSLADAIPVFKSGGWTVLRGKDPMTDKTSCTGVLSGDYGIQLSEEALYIRIRGGVRSITLRFDDQQPERLRLATDFERKGTIVLKGNELTKAMGSTRIRTQVMTILDRLDQKDLDITGIREAHENIRNGCPGNAISSSPASSEPSLCSNLVIGRMKNLGISDADIKSICTK